VFFNLQILEFQISELMYLEIVTPEKMLYTGEIHLVKLPGSQGSFEVMKDHAAIISTLESGEIKVISNDGEENFFEITGGVIEVAKNNVIILATTE